jgi:hypothetical protein
MKMQLNRDYVHVHASGISVAFQKDVPVYVPPRLVQDIIGIGGVAVDAAGRGTEAEAYANIERTRTEADEREPKIEAGIQALLARNQRGDFTAGGKPNRNVLMSVTGLDVSEKELEPLWEKAKKALQ